MDYSIIVAALITGTLTVGGTIGAARFGRRVAQTAGAAVQTAEQVEAARLVEDARDEAVRVKTEAAAEAAAVVAAAKEKADLTVAEREGWHAYQLEALRGELEAAKNDNADLRRRLGDGKL